MNDPAPQTAADAPEAAPATPSPAALSAFLTFRIAAHDCGIDIRKVHEIVGLLPVTPLHGSPRAVSGVINLRGNVVPVLSLRALFNLEAGKVKPNNVFIIIDHEQELIGLAVDQVQDVVRFSAGQISLPDTGRPGVASAFVQAVGTGHGRAVHLLAIERILDFPNGQARAQ